MPAEALAGTPLDIEVKRFRSAADALQGQDYFRASPFPPGRPALLIWQSPRALLAAPGDARLPRFEAAAQASAAAGWPVALRRAGGRICPVSPGTLQLAISRPVSSGVTIGTAYEEMAVLVETLLARFGVRGGRGPCPEAFCPGRYDIAVAGRKIAGLAQIWRRHGDEMTAITGASVIIDESPLELADAVNRFYRDMPDMPPCRAEAIGTLSVMAGRQVQAEEALEVLCSLVASSVPRRRASSDQFGRAG